MSKKRIFKIKKKGEFVTIQNSFFDIPTLSFKAKGVLCSLISKPTNWDVRTAQLVNSSTDGKHSVLTAINELIKHGYIRKDWLRDDIGQIMGVIYYVFEDPNQNEEWVKENKEIKDDSTPSSCNAPKKVSSNNLNPKGERPSKQNSQGEKKNPPTPEPTKQSDDQGDTDKSGTDIPPSDKPTSGNQQSDKPMSENQAHTNNHSTSGEGYLQKHTLTNAGEEELVSALTATMQFQCGLRHFQIDEVKSWLNDNPDKLKSFNQWFHTNIRLNLADKNSGIENPAGYSWYRLKGVLNGEITISSDDSNIEVDIIDRLNFEVEKPDPEGLKKIASLFKDSDLKKYFNQRGRN